MSKHLELRFSVSDTVLLTNMEDLARQMDGIGYEEMVRLAEQTHEISQLDHMISRIDAIQAELWRRSQKRSGNGQSSLQEKIEDQDDFV